MKQLWLIFISLIMAVGVFANDSEVKLRTYYYDVCLEKTSVKEFASYLAINENKKDIITEGYRSVIWFLWADYYFNPFKKWNCFLNGKQALEMLIKENKHGKTMYLNSGDWVENFTALEYQFKRWKLYHYNNDKLSPFFVDEDLKELDMKDLIAAITIVNKHEKNN